MQLVVPAPSDNYDIPFLIVIHRMLVSREWRLPNSLRPSIGPRDDTIHIDIKSEHHEYVLGLRSCILPAKVIYSFLLNIMFSDAPIRLESYPLISDTGGVAVMGSLLVPGGVEYHAALHVGEVGHQRPVLDLDVPVLESGQVDLEHVGVDDSQARCLPPHRVEAVL